MKFDLLISLIASSLAPFFDQRNEKAGWGGSHVHGGGGACRCGADVGLSTRPNPSNTQRLNYTQLTLPKQSDNSTLNAGSVPSGIHRRGN